MRSRRTCSSAALACWSTVLLAVIADALAGREPVHVVGVGALGASLAVARLLLPGRLRGLFGVLSSIVVAQPVWHLAAAAVQGAGSRSYGFTVDDAMSVLVVLLAAATVAGVGLAESMLEAARSSLLTLLAALRFLRGTEPRVDLRPSVGLFPLVVPPTARPTAHRYAARRGPPAVESICAGRVPGTVWAGS